MKKILFAIVVLLFVVVIKFGGHENTLNNASGKDTVVSFNKGAFFITRSADTRFPLFPSMGGSSIMRDVEAMYETKDKVYLIGTNKSSMDKRAENGAIEFVDVIYTSYAVIDLSSSTMQICNLSDLEAPKPLMNSTALKEGLVIELQSFSEFTESDQKIFQDREQFSVLS